jgi:hypothetical protein
LAFSRAKKALVRKIVERLAEDPQVLYERVERAREVFGPPWPGLTPAITDARREGRRERVAGWRWLEDPLKGWTVAEWTPRRRRTQLGRRAREMPRDGFDANRTRLSTP